MNYKENYLKGRGLDRSDIILCEVCKSVAVDIHHIVPRSKFGSKRIEECNAFTNLIALCRECHELAHKEVIKKEELYHLVELRSRIIEMYGKDYYNKLSNGEE